MLQVLHLWQLAGGDLDAVLRKAGLLRTKPAISQLAQYVLGSGEAFGQSREQALLLDNTTVILPQQQLRQVLFYIPDRPSQLVNSLRHACR